MRPLERGTARRVEWGLCVLMLLAASGCNRLTFVKPDLGRGDFHRTAPELDIRTDNRQDGARKALQQAQAAFAAGRIDEAGAFADAPPPSLAVSHDRAPWYLPMPAAEPLGSRE